MAPIIATGILCLELAAVAPPPQAPRPAGEHVRAVRRNPFSRLGHAIRRAGSLEPALSMRFSSWGIPDPDKAPEQKSPARTERKDGLLLR